MRALIDGDIITYSVGFASDKNFYDVAGLTFPTKKEAIEFCEKSSIPVDEIVKRVEQEPVGYCLHSVKQLITSILEETEADDYQIYLTGGGNFREKVAVTKPYKGNRDVLHKPTYYMEIKKYLKEVWGAETVSGMEADDEMAIQQYNNKTTSSIICSLDKDLDQVPGWHYNWRKKNVYNVTPLEGDRFFMRQMLTGDQVDNIQGCPMVGTKIASRVLDHLTDVNTMWEKVEEQYWLSYYKYGKHGDLNEFYKTIDGIILEHARLLYIKRERGEDLPSYIKV